MRMVDLILQKRAGERLSAEALQALVRGAADGSIPDYQLAAWLMAVCWRGMTDEETADLTLPMAASCKRRPSAGSWGTRIEPDWGRAKARKSHRLVLPGVHGRPTAIDPDRAIAQRLADSNGT